MDAGRITLIESPTKVHAEGTPPKLISEFIGAVNTGTDGVSIALMQSPAGWSEPGQRPEFDEYSLVLEGEMVVEGGPESVTESVTVRAGQAVHIPKGVWVRYSTPGGAKYVAVCLPAFTPDRVHRDS